MSKILTPLELKIMSILWELKKAYVKEIIEQWEETPKPAYNTISTKVRVLEEKGFVDHKAFGKTHQYFPVITKEKYQQQFMKSTLHNVFDGSLSKLITSMVDSKTLDESEVQELQNLINKIEKDD